MTSSKYPIAADVLLTILGKKRYISLIPNRTLRAPLIVEKNLIKPPPKRGRDDTTKNASFGGEGKDKYANTSTNPPIGSTQLVPSCFENLFKGKRVTIEMSMHFIVDFHDSSSTTKIRVKVIKDWWEEYVERIRAQCVTSILKGESLEVQGAAEGETNTSDVGKDLPIKKPLIHGGGLL
ncbi:hypothetical protein GOBAR_DD13257 [Gossypium barbadense]|nr:hypothetical protein GOBAR_DD13257 [Gossypium barbadense]